MRVSSPSRPMLSATAVGWRGADIAAIVLAAGFVAACGMLTAPLHFDELYHRFAALSWLETGRFTILNGSYERAWPFTLMVAWSFGIDAARAGNRVGDIGHAVASHCEGYGVVRDHSVPGKRPGPRYGRLLPFLHRPPGVLAGRRLGH